MHFFRFYISYIIAPAISLTYVASVTIWIQINTLLYLVNISTNRQKWKTRGYAFINLATNLFSVLHVCIWASEPLKSPFSSFFLVGVQEETRRLRNVLSRDQEHDGRSGTNERKLAPIKFGTHSEGWQETDLWCNLGSWTQASPNGRVSNFAYVQLWR